MVNTFASVTVDVGSGAEWLALLRAFLPWMLGCFGIGVLTGLLLRRHIAFAIVCAAAVGVAVSVYSVWTSPTRSTQWSPEFPLVSILYLAGPFFVIFVAPSVAGALVPCLWHHRHNHLTNR
jgi:hypothetical protein